jgi:hypothetical protein
MQQIFVSNSGKDENDGLTRQTPVRSWKRVKGVLSENHIRTYWWCSPARIGMATIAPDGWTARCEGASFCNATCVRA